VIEGYNIDLRKKEENWRRKNKHDNKNMRISLNNEAYFQETAHSQYSI